MFANYFVMASVAQSSKIFIVEWLTRYLKLTIFFFYRCNLLAMKKSAAHWFEVVSSLFPPRYANEKLASASINFNFGTDDA